MPGPARRSRLVALGLSVGGLIGLVTGMVATEQPLPATPGRPGPSVGAPTDPFAAGGPATPASSAAPQADGRIRQTITSAS